MDENIINSFDILKKINNTSGHCKLHYILSETVMLANVTLFKMSLYLSSQSKVADCL